MSTCYHAPADPDSTRRRRCFLDRNQDERNVRATLHSPVDQPISIVPGQRANLRSATLRVFARAPWSPSVSFLLRNLAPCVFPLGRPHRRTAAQISSNEQDCTRERCTSGKHPTLQPARRQLGPDTLPEGTRQARSPAFDKAVPGPCKKRPRAGALADEVAPRAL